MFTILGDELGGPILEIEEDDINIFGVGKSMEKSLFAFLIRKLFLFWKYIISFIQVCRFVLFGGKPMKINFQTFVSSPNKFLEFQGCKLK
jgi:hypothetical protein